MLKRIGRLFAAKSEKVIASFGEARLTADYDGRMEIRGGSKDDRGAAMEWISLFMHEAILKPPFPGRGLDQPAMEAADLRNAARRV